MSVLSRELVFLILQFCNEEGFNKTAHILGRESGYYFDLKYFLDMVLCGEWDKAERYLSDFTKIDDDKYSKKIYFEMRKQKYLEALDNKNHVEAVDILKTDLKVFELGNEELYKEITQLLALNDIRDHLSLSSYGNTRSAREILVCMLRKVIVASPSFRGKLKFPTIDSQRLRCLLNQSLNWQHGLCENPQPIPHIESLFVDHVCPLQQNRCDSGPSTRTHSTAATGATCQVIERREGSNNDSVRRVDETQNEVTPTVSYPDQSNSSVAIVDDDLPKTVARTLNETSSPTSMDFHPFHHTLLLVGSSIGDVGLWGVKSGEKMLSRNFKVWDIGACSVEFKAAFAKDLCVSANRVMWSPDGSLFGVAYSKHIVQLYTYYGGNDVHQSLEIDAHVGGVNDLGFSISAEQLIRVITGGDDKKVKVWDAATGAKMYTFDGHDAPVHSICPHAKECTHFIFSTSVDGKIRVWLYDSLGSRIDNDTPGRGCTTMFYSTDGKRLFSCGTNKDGETILVEWNESEGSSKRIYKGLEACSLATVQCDRSKKQILVAGHDHSVKLWHMDSVDLLTTINVDGGLPATPRLHFNKEGTLLAVSANENRIKILATSSGLQSLQTVEHCSLNASRIICETLRKTQDKKLTTSDGEVGIWDAKVNGEARNWADVPYRLNEEYNNKRDRSVKEISRSRFRLLRLPAQVKTNEISRLIYTNFGNAILALGSNGVHLLWKWSRSDLNLQGKATTEVLPQLRHPRIGLEPMTNDLMVTNPDKAIPCLALSKNDSYLISASGGMISLYNMMLFKKIVAFKSTPKGPTCLAFHPRDNNIVAIGMDNSTIVIYNAHLDKVESILKGHNNVVTGLSFSNELNVLVSSGADSQIIVWDMNGWKKLNNKFLVTATYGRTLESLTLHVQFHQDQTQFLIVHQTQLAIYKARELQCLKMRFIEDVPVPLHHVTFSCDCQMVYAGFVDGTVLIYDGLELVPLCQIKPTSYISRDISDNVSSVVIAANPQIPSQFAVGLSNGGVYVIEPQKDDGNWPNSISDKTPPETSIVADNFEFLH